MKGKAEPVAIWRPTAFRGRMGVGVELREHPPTPFVGRTDELALLRGTFRRTVRESSVQLVTVVGEPGVGKSRLISELARFIDELPEVVVRYRQGRCLPYGEGITFWALSEVVKAEAGILESDEPEEAAAKLAHAVEAFVEDPSERDWVRARLGPLVGLGDPAAGTVARQESFTAWRRFFEAVAAERPLVLVMEDLHWADDPLLEFLDHLIDWSTRVPLLVVCATRPELFEHHPEWGGGKRNSTTVSLPPLSSRQTAMLVSALLDQAVLPAEAQTMLLERSGGNPLYAEEFVRMLTDRGILDPRGGLRLDPSGEVPVPQTVQALIAARLDTLSPEQKGLLHDAAVVGRVFWAGALAAMSGRDESEVRDLLHESVRKELVRPSRVSSFRGQVEYSFWHVLIRDVAYGQIPRAARGAKHRAAAEWIEAASSDRVADQAELLAHHYGQALELARVLGLGAEADELVDVTGRALVMAGDRAARLDTAKAARYYERALDLLPEGHRARPGVLLALARSMTASGRFAEATELYRRSIAGYREAGDRRGLGLALAMSGRAMYNQADPSGADSSLTEAVAILEAEPPGPELAGAYGRAAGQALVQSRYRECLDWAEKALALAEELGLEDEAVRARQFRGAARAELGLPGGLEDLWTALRQGLELGLGEETSVAYGNLAYQLWLEDGPAIGEQVWSASVEFSDVRGFAAQGMWSRVGLMEVLYDLGRWDRLLELAAEVEGWDRVHELALLAPLARVHRARVLLRQDRVGEAAVLVPTFLDELRATSRTEFVAPALVIAAAIEDAQGHRETALSLIEVFREDTAEHLNFRAEWLPDALRIVLREDVPRDVPETVLAMARALVPDDELSSSRYRIALATGRAILLAAEGSLEEAATAHSRGRHRVGDLRPRGRGGPGPPGARPGARRAGTGGRGRGSRRRGAGRAPGPRGPKPRRRGGRRAHRAGRPDVLTDHDPSRRGAGAACRVGTRRAHPTRLAGPARRAGRHRRLGPPRRGSGGARRPPHGRPGGPGLSAARRGRHRGGAPRTGRLVARPPRAVPSVVGRRGVRAPRRGHAGPVRGGRAGPGAPVRRAGHHLAAPGGKGREPGRTPVALLERPHPGPGNGPVRVDRRPRRHGPATPP